MGSRTQRVRRQRSSDLEVEWLVAQLSDEAEHWKTKAQELEQVVDALRVELHGLRIETDIADAWRCGLVAEANELARSAGVGPIEGVKARPITGLMLSVAITFVAWAPLAALAYGAFRLFAS